MKTKLTPQQIEWASKHDWFLRDNKDGSITCRGDVGEPETVIHNNFQDLRDWAGY